MKFYQEVHSAQSQLPVAQHGMLRHAQAADAGLPSLLVLLHVRTSAATGA